MNIDIFTLIVQIINFLALIFILNKLLYKPLIKMMKDRREYIKGSIDGAENKLKEAEKIRTEYETELKKIENYKKEKINKIDEELFNYKNNEIVKIKEELEIKKNEFIEQLENEKNNILDNMIKQFCYNTKDLLNNIFLSLSNNSLNKIILDKFKTEILNLSDENVDKINNTNNKIIDFYSSFELSWEEMDSIKDTFDKRNITYDNINFVVDTKMVLGNKISVNGLIINSNIQNIIDQFTLNLNKII